MMSAILDDDTSVTPSILIIISGNVPDVFPERSDYVMTSVQTHSGAPAAPARGPPPIGEARGPACVADEGRPRGLPRFCTDGPSLRASSLAARPDAYRHGGRPLLATRSPPSHQRPGDSGGTHRTFTVLSFPVLSNDPRSLCSGPCSGRGILRVGPETGRP